MIIPQEWEFNTDKEISYDEYDVLEKFLSQYRGKDVIVADNHRMDFARVPFEKEKVTFKPNEEFWKCLDFQRRIVHEGKPYIVKLGLWRMNPQEDEPKCLTISDFNIITPGKRHVLTLTTNDLFKANIFYNIVDIFDENKIISPEAAYSKRMYINKKLQEFINNHEWSKIVEGVREKPTLANALFILGKPISSFSSFSAYFGTILYQLITYRKEHENELTKTDLLELDKVILELSKTELLKVRLSDSTAVSKMSPSGSILLDDYYQSSQMRISEQYNVANGELMEEKKTLNKVLRQFKDR